MKKISIIDYGLCNIFNVVEAFKHIGCDVIVTDESEKIKNADYLVLPGVGAFQNGMNGLNEKHLIEPIISYVEQSKPFLGICLGMQMMMSSSSEFGEALGLNLISGNVNKIPHKVENRKNKIPHIGWNNLIMNDIDIKKIFTRTRKTYPVYFVHSYMASCDDQADCIAYTDYNGLKIPAIVKKYNAIGCQFHPEKSGHVGLDLLKNFIQI